MIKNLPSKNTSKRNKHRRLPLEQLTDHQFQQLLGEELLQPRPEAIATLLRKASELMRKD